MPKKGTKHNSLDKKSFTFDFDEHAPLDQPEEVTLPLQRLSTLKWIAIAQLSYAVIGYAVDIIGGVLDKAYLPTFIQAPGGISLLTIVATFLVLFECTNNSNNRTQLLVYVILVVLDLLGWAVSLIYTSSKDRSVNTAIVATAPYVFVALLQSLGLAEAIKLRNSSENPYVPLSTHKAAPSSSADEVSTRAFYSLAFFPLRRICALQLMYIICIGYVRVFASVSTPSKAIMEVMLSPAAGLCTLFAAVCVMFNTHEGYKLTKIYMASVGVDMAIGLTRLVVGFSIGNQLLHEHVDAKAYLLSAAMWNLFIYLLWVIGFMEGYKTKRILFEHNNITTQVDHIFAL